jgi:hypothetical protein
MSVVLAGCDPPSSPKTRTHGGPTAEAWYGRAVDELAALNRQANQSFEQGKSDAAASLILKGEPLSTRIMSVPQPTLAATEAASDLDELYGRMLLSNRNYGWARLLFQKNLVRWKYWNPQSAETAARRKQAEAEIAECDRRVASEEAKPGLDRRRPAPKAK